MKPKQIFSSKWSSGLDISGLPNQSSTLLVPDDLSRALEVFQLERGWTMGELLFFLVEKYRMVVAQQKLSLDHQKLTTQYQVEGLSLQRVDFRVDPVVWHILKCMARAYGISICKFFVFLLVRELSGVNEEFSGVPTKNAVPEEIKDIYYIIFYDELQLRYRRNTRKLEIKQNST